MTKLKRMKVRTSPMKNQPRSYYAIGMKQKSENSTMIVVSSKTTNSLTML